MKCPGCGLTLEREQPNPNWLVCDVCSWEGTAVEADFGQWDDEEDD